MIRIVHILKELTRNLWRNPGTAFGSLLSLLLLFLMFDLFWIASLTSDKFYRDLLSELRMEIYLNEETPDSLIERLTDSIMFNEGVVVVRYVSKAEAPMAIAFLVAPSGVVINTNPGFS